ncbi:MAG: hypothetical protein U0787_14875 [Polyangia bacterium]
MSKITLTGYVYRNQDGLFVSHCNELDIDTWAPTMDEVRRLTPDMIATYFAMAIQMNMLEDVLGHLCVPSSGHLPPHVTSWSATPADGSETSFCTQFDSVQAA